MSSQGWFIFWEIFSATGTIVVITGLFIEYGFGTFAFLKFWGRHAVPEYHVKIEAPREHKGSAMVVLGITIELFGAVGIFVQSLRVETQHRAELEQVRNDTAHAIEESGFANERAANAEKASAKARTAAAQAEAHLGDAEKQAAEASAKAEQFRLQIAEAEHAAAAAKLQQAKLERLLSGSLELEDDSSLLSLKKFAGTPYFVKTMPSRIAFLTIHTVDDSLRLNASQRFAMSFKRLEIFAEWKYNRVPDDPRSPPVPEGVTLLTWRVDKPDSPEQHAFRAAEALRCVLMGQLGIQTFHYEATNLSEYPSLPREGVLIQVGKLSVEYELTIQQLESRAGSTGCQDEITTGQ